MDYDDQTAERLEAVYLGPDVVAQRQDTLRRLKLKPGERVIDIGSGPGFLCQEMAEIVGPGGHVTGIDLSSAMVRRSKERNSRPWVSFRQGDATALPEEDVSYDVVVSVQVAEYVPDISCFCSEAYRVLKPGGRGLIIATDWDAIAWHSDDHERMSRVLQAFKSHCAHSCLPRTLAPHLREVGFSVTSVAIFPIVNLQWLEGCYSQKVAPFITAYVRSQGTLPEDELQAWEVELARLGDEGRYFFSSNRYIFEIERPAIE